MDRRDIATWVSGPREALAGQGIDLGYRGERLGLPEAGTGSIAGFGRRAGGLFIDWIACAIVVQLFFRQYAYGSQMHGLLTLAAFFLIKSIFTFLGGASFGQRIVGVRVASLSGKPYINPFLAFLRTLLICLVIPAVVWDRDGRGLHDRICQTAVLRARG